MWLNDWNDMCITNLSHLVCAAKDVQMESHILIICTPIHLIMDEIQVYKIMTMTAAELPYHIAFYWSAMTQSAKCSDSI